MSAISPCSMMGLGVKNENSTVIYPLIADGPHYSQQETGANSCEWASSPSFHSYKNAAISILLSLRSYHKPAWLVSCAERPQGLSPLS